MKHLTCLAVLMVLASPVASADFDKGMAAYERRDYVTAAKEWRPLADQGHPEAQLRLGTLYYDGLGVPQDSELGIKLVRKAADQGNAMAQGVLGAAYADGHGLPQDYIEAHKWTNLAAARGFERARKVRDIVAKKMTPDQIVEAQKLAREWLKQFEARKAK